jgi:hypothetical protein
MGEAAGRVIICARRSLQPLVSRQPRSVMPDPPLFERRPSTRLDPLIVAFRNAWLFLLPFHFRSPGPATRVVVPVP